jgi:hypothetical protein
MYHYGGALRGILYPHIVPTAHTKASQSSPIIIIEESSSIATNTPPPRRSSIGYRPRATIFHSLQPMPDRYSRAHKVAKMAQQCGADSPTFSGVEQNTIVETYTRLPTPPEDSGEDIGLDFNPHLPPWPAALQSESAPDTAELPHLPDTPFASPSPAIPIAHRRSPSPLVLAVDAAADSLDLSCIPESPLLDNRPSIDSRPSFDTLVRDLIQSTPDSPIGGHIPTRSQVLSDSAAAPKPKRSFNVGTLLTRGKSTPRIEISCADTDSNVFSDPVEVTGARSENLHPTRSETDTRSATPPMFTARESPRMHSRTDGSSDSSDDMDDLQLPITEVRDFGLASDGTRSKKASKVPDPKGRSSAKSHESLKDSALSKAHKSVKDSANTHHEQASTQHPIPESDPDYCEDCISPRNNAPHKEFPKTLRKADGHSTTGKVVIDAKAAKADAPKSLKGSERKDGKNAKSGKDGNAHPTSVLDDVKSLKGSERKEGKNAKSWWSGKDGNAHPTGIPDDVTGQLSPPGTPKPKKRAVLKAKGKVAIRKVSVQLLQPCSAPQTCPTSLLAQTLQMLGI